MKTRTRIFSLIIIMTIVALIVGGLAIGMLYKAALEEERARLVGIVQSQARLIEAVARFDMVYSQEDYPEGAQAATCSQIKDALEQYPGTQRDGRIYRCQTQRG